MKLNRIKDAVILAGGKGTRLSEQTKVIPKPLVDVAGKPIIIRIMEHLADYGIENFYILGGYKVEEIYSYFLSNIMLTNSLSLSSNTSLHIKNAKLKDCNIHILDTGKDSGTAERIYILKNTELSEKPFIITYGDTYSDVDLTKVEEQLKDDRIISLCAVPYTERFGLVKITNDNYVEEFKEKSESKEYFVNGGFICVNPEIFEILDNTHYDFSKDTLESPKLYGKIGAYIHRGYWKAVDTQRDLDEINKEFLNKGEI